MRARAWVLALLMCGCAETSPSHGDARSDVPQVVAEVSEDVEMDEPDIRLNTIDVPVSVSDDSWENIVPASRPRVRTTPPMNRDRLWDLDSVPQEAAEATALLRICSSEIDWANDLDCIGIWQVIRYVRSSRCDNTRFREGVRPERRISQCRLQDGSLVQVGPTEAIPDAQETYLSAMRRTSGRALGVLPQRAASREWIGHIQLDCSQPEGWSSTLVWEGLMSRRCRSAVELVTRLVSGAPDMLTRTAIPVAWGGRCERHCSDPSDLSTCRTTGACDDHFACRRGLARIPDTDTGNAFWCSTHSPGCADDVDPVCLALGYGNSDGVSSGGGVRNPDNLGGVGEEPTRTP